MKPVEFVKEFLPYAIETENKSGISAYFILAQAALESGWGKHTPGNMFFGIKAKNWNGKKQLLTTTEYHSTPDVNYPEIISITQMPNGKYKYKIKDWFRAYDTPEECFTDHIKLFVGLSRYSKAMSVARDPYAFAKEIAKAGYATDPNYANTLTKLINMIKKISQDLLKFK